MEGDDKIPPVLDKSLIISIHALRMEGDSAGRPTSPAGGGFLSTPSAWRATPITNISTN